MGLETPQPNPEKREEQAEKVLTFLHRTNAEEVFATDESRKEFLRSLSFEDFKDLLVRLNGLIRDIPLDERTTDGTTVELTGAIGGFVPPKYEDKDTLLKEALEAVQEMDNLNDIALLLSCAINAIHPFADANGRTNRVIYTLLTKGYKETPEDNEKLTKILGEDGREEVDVNPSWYESELKVLLKEGMGLDVKDRTQPSGIWETKRIERTVKYNENISPEVIKEFEDIILKPTEGDYSFIAIYKYLKDENRLNNKYYKIFYGEEKQPVRTAILLENLTPDLTERDLKAIIDSYYEVKKEYVEKIIETISHPDGYRHPKDENKTLKDYIKEKIDSVQEFKDMLKWVTEYENVIEQNNNDTEAEPVKQFYNEGVERFGKNPNFSIQIKMLANKINYGKL